MRLYEFITRNIELILQAFEDFARTIQTLVPQTASSYPCVVNV